MPLWSPLPSSTSPRSFRFTPGADAFVGPADQAFVMGGVLLGTAVEAIEAAAKRPLLWVTAQFLGNAKPGDAIDINVDLPVEGRRITQAGAMLAVAGTPIVHVMAALGGRDDAEEAAFHDMPNVPAPEDCPLRDDNEFVRPDNLWGAFEVREAFCDENVGIDRAWFRLVEDTPTSAGFLSVVADFMPGGHSATQGCSSLDNTLRMHRRAQSRWVLLDSHLTYVGGGAFHGRTHIFGEDGALLATGAQSGRLPRRPPAPLA